jgi:hypothetical protein
MEFDTGAFFSENEDDEVRGMAIIETAEERGPLGEVPAYRIAEKWEPAGEEPQWVKYWMSAETLHARLQSGKCEYLKELSDDQFEGVLSLAGVEKTAPSMA